mgnify:CR=1 FL=1
MIRRPPRSTRKESSAASDVYKRQALNAQGDTKSYRNVLIFSFFLNIFLNPLFIWGYGIVPAYGIGGLAIATVIAQSIGTIYLAYKINSCKLRKYLSIKCFIPKFILLKELFSQAMPIMFSMLFIGVGIFNILYFIGQFGDLATAGYGAASVSYTHLTLPTTPYV